ncbi:MAG: biliverdin-producing heme oxygenase [Vicinamibacterales bacterium]
MSAHTRGPSIAVSDAAAPPLHRPAMSSSEPEHLLYLVRAHTGSLHDALDARLQPDGAPMAQARYTAFLRATSAIALPLELPLAIHLGPLVVRERAGERRARLAHDLELLGSSLAEPWPALPVIESAADAFGAAYVLLGSHLGGEVIARRLFGRDAGPATPTSYARLYGPDLGPMWTRFTDALVVFGGAHDAMVRRHVAAVAVALFTAFGLALDREGVPR